MARYRSLDDDTFAPEIENTLRPLRKQKEATSQMDDEQNTKNKVLWDYVMSSINRATTSIRRPVSQAAHFEIKPAIIQIIQNIVQFKGLVHKNLNLHIANFQKFAISTSKQALLLMPSSLGCFLSPSKTR